MQGMANLARVERRAKLFLSGNYKESAAELQRAIASGVTSSNTTNEGSRAKHHVLLDVTPEAIARCNSAADSL